MQKKTKKSLIKRRKIIIKKKAVGRIKRYRLPERSFILYLKAEIRLGIYTLVVRTLANLMKRYPKSRLEISICTLDNGPTVCTNRKGKIHEFWSIQLLTNI